MWLVSGLFRIIPLFFLTLLWIIQTTWFWSWLATGLEPGLSIEKENKGLVPFSLHLKECKHPLAYAKDVSLVLDWAYFIQTLSLRLASCHVGFLTLNLPQEQNKSDTPPPFELIVELCQRIHTWDITWQDDEHTNHFTRNEKGECTFLYHGQIYIANIHNLSNHVLVTTQPYAKAPLLKIKLTKEDIDIRAIDKPWHAYITTTTWKLTDGESLSAQGTWKGSTIEGQLTHPWVGTIQGWHNNNAWCIHPFYIYDGMIAASSDIITATHIHWLDMLLDATFNIKEKEKPWKIKATTSYGEAKFQGHLEKNGHLIFEGKAFQAVNLKGSIAINWDNIMLSQLDCHYDIQHPIAPLLSFLDENHVIEGKLRAHLTVQGSLDNPLCKGDIYIQNGLYHNIELGIWLAPIQTHIKNTDGKTWKIQNLTAYDRTSRNNQEPAGDIQGSGSIIWSLTDPAKPSFDIALKLDKVDIAHGDRFQSDASGTLRIIGSEPRVEGIISLQNTAIHLDAMDDADNVIIRREKESPEKDADLPNVLPLNIALTTTDIRVDGLGFESIWSGHMIAQGYITKPYLVGTITCIKGHMNMLGIPMKIKSSEITFIKDDPNTPQLNITAVHALSSQEKIFFQATGSINRPEAKFNSNMGLTQRDIVSRMLFGQTSENISIWQSIQLANTLASLNSRKNQMSWAEQLRRTLGIESFEIKSIENENGTTTQAPSIAKRFGKTRLTVDAATSGSPGRATIETNIHPNVTLNADMGGDHSAGIGADWVYNY